MAAVLTGAGQGRGRRRFVKNDKTRRRKVENGDFLTPGELGGAGASGPGPPAPGPDVQGMKGCIGVNLGRSLHRLTPSTTAEETKKETKESQPSAGRGERRGPAAAPKPADLRTSRVPEAP